MSLFKIFSKRKSDLRQQTEPGVNKLQAILFSKGDKTKVKDCTMQIELSAHDAAVALQGSVLATHIVMPRLANFYPEKDLTSTEKEIRESLAETQSEFFLKIELSRDGKCTLPFFSRDVESSRKKVLPLASGRYRDVVPLLLIEHQNDVLLVMYPSSAFYISSKPANQGGLQNTKFSDKEEDFLESIDLTNFRSFRMRTSELIARNSAAGAGATGSTSPKGKKRKAQSSPAKSSSGSKAKQISAPALAPAAAVETTFLDQDDSSCANHHSAQRPKTKRRTAATKASKSTTTTTTAAPRSRNKNTIIDESSTSEDDADEPPAKRAKLEETHHEHQQQEQSFSFTGVFEPEVPRHHLGNNTTQAPSRSSALLIHENGTRIVEMNMNVTFRQTPDGVFTMLFATPSAQDAQRFPFNNATVQFSPTFQIHENQQQAQQALHREVQYHYRLLNGLPLSPPPQAPTVKQEADEDSVPAPACSRTAVAQQQQQQQQARTTQYSLQQLSAEEQLNQEMESPISTLVHSQQQQYSQRESPGSFGLSPVQPLTPDPFSFWTNDSQQ